jgi:hypothetical protein
MSKAKEELSVTNEEKALELSDEELAAVAGGAGPFGDLKDALGDGQIPLEQPRVSAVHI